MFLICFGKFPVFPQIPCFACAVATLKIWNYRGRPPPLPCGQTEILKTLPSHTNVWAVIIYDNQTNPNLLMALLHCWTHCWTRIPTRTRIRRVFPLATIVMC